MKFRIPAVTALLLCSSLVASHASVNAMTVPSAAKQSIRITSISAHCLDEFDEEDVIYVIEGAKVCKINIRVLGRGSLKSKVAIEYYDSEDGWSRSSWKVQTTNAAGRATFPMTISFPNQPEDDCYEGDTYSYRFAVAKNGKYKAFRSSAFDISFTSADNNPACAGYDETME